MFIEEERVDLTLASVKSHLLDVEYYNVIFHVKGKMPMEDFFIPGSVSLNRTWKKCREKVAG